MTLDIYAHGFEEARGRDDIADKLTAAFGGLLAVESDGPHPGALATEMGAWLSACMDDAEFQERLAAWYQQ